MEDTMKGLMLQMLRKMTLASFVILVSYNVTEISCSDRLGKTESNQDVSVEDIVIKDALDKFKHVLQNKDGKVGRISCKFELHKNQPLKAVTKAYYDDYHKKPDFYSHEYNPSNDARPDAVIEITYMAHKDYLSLVHKDGKERRRLAEKTVDLPSGFSA